MRLRPYISSKDYQHVAKWIDDERTHSLWSADRIPYPMTEASLNDLLKREAEEWNGNAYVATEDDGQPVGFFAYSVNVENNEGFLRFIVVDNTKRGKGYGCQMLKLASKYAFEITGATSVHLNVFDVNEGAKKCYSKAGFMEQGTTRNAFTHKDESWGRCHMAAERKYGLCN